LPQTNHLCTEQLFSSRETILPWNKSQLPSPAANRNNAKKPQSFAGRGFGRSLAKPFRRAQPMHKLH
jgi:hypothetical protein